MDYQQIIYDIDEGILTITLNRPDKLNAFTGQMMTEMINRTLMMKKMIIK